MLKRFIRALLIGIAIGGSCAPAMAQVTPWGQQLYPITNIQPYTYRNLNATLQVVDSGPTAVFGIEALNTSAAAAFVQCWNLIPPNITLGTTIPILEMIVPATTGYLAIPLPSPGVAFSIGLTCASTTSESGTTGSANGVQLFVQYR